MYIVAGIIVAIVVFLSVGYVKSPPNTATIISGPGKHPRVLIGKAGFKIPFLERVDRMGIGQIDIDIETEDYIPTKDFINIQVDAIAQVAVDTSPENIEIAMRNFLNKSSDDVRNTITKSLQGNLREIIGTMELKDICQNKAEFSEQVKSNAKEDIAQLGICILSNAPESEIKGILTTGQCKEVIASKNQKKIEASIRKLEKREIYFFHRESQEYPERLAQLYEPPNLLYYIGRLPNFSKPILAIVGARRATIYGRKMAREFAKRLAECGIQIVSGMAAGVDAAGHKGALDANGYTLGVLGGGIDTIYPVENFNLYQQVYQMGGVLSEYNMGISPQKGLFPMRNRIISGLSDGIFVTEAGARSGSLITADQGLEQGKDIFALPGRITDCMSRGCNDLISQGAVLVRSPEDIMDIIIKEGKTGNKKKNMDVNREKFFKEQKFFCENKKEEKVYSLLDEIHPMTFENLLENSGFSAFELQHILMKFELKNIIYQIEQNVYLRKV